MKNLIHRLHRSVSSEQDRQILAIKPFCHYDQVIKQQGPIVAGTRRQFNQGTTALACGRLGMRASSSRIQLSRQSLHMLVLLTQQVEPMSGIGMQILMTQLNIPAHSVRCIVSSYAFKNIKEEK